VSECSRRFRRVPLWGPPVPNDQGWPTGPFDQAYLVQVVNQWASLKWGVTTLERGGYYLLKERGLPLFKEGVTTLVIKWLRLPCLYKRGERHTMCVQSLPHLLLPPAHRLAKPCPRELSTISTTTPSCCWNRSHLLLPLACWIKKRETSSSCTCASLRRCCSFAVLIGSNIVNNFTELR